MLIRSQDKSRLINFNNTRELRFWECAQGFNITDCVCPLGSYSTREKALGVLDMIQEAYTKTGVAKSIVSEMAKVLGRASAGIDDELAKSTGEALVKLMCFQMPEDSEVEV